METSKRSLVKSISYRTYSIIASAVIFWSMTASLTQTAKFVVCIEFVKILSYYIHERIWAYIRFGIIHPIGKTIWFTGLSGSGKSTLAEAVAEKLTQKGYPVQILDGDKVRNTINKGLGFSPEDRRRNIFNIAHIAKLLNEAGVIVLVPVISPYQELRDMARSIISDFIGIYVNCPIEECEKRDPKGLYKKVRAGEIKNFTGISDAYEIPSDFHEINTQNTKIKDCVNRILAIVV